ncbi:Eukaryotic/viral aspartic protease, partial [Phytophthora megakarya]
FDYEPRSEEKASDKGERIKICGTSYAVKRTEPTTTRLLDTEFDHDAKDEDDYVDDEFNAPVQGPDLHEDADVFVTKRGGVKSLSQNHGYEFEEAGKPEPAQDDIDELNDDLKESSTMTRSASQRTTKKDGNRPLINGDIPVANKTLGQCLNVILDTSSWIQLFTPKAARQAVWVELVEELSHPVNSTTHAYPSSTALADWTASEAGTELQRWKRKLKTAFGSKDVGIGQQPVARSAGARVNPPNIPLPRMPKKATRAVFGSAEQSPCFHDPRMVIPRSESRKARIAPEAEQTESTAITRPDTGRSSSRRQAADDGSSSDKDNPFYQDNEEKDATTGWCGRSITPFRGILDESENSMQLLRGFGYEMKDSISKDEAHLEFAE